MKINTYSEQANKKESNILEQLYIIKKINKTLK